MPINYEELAKAVQEEETKQETTKNEELVKKAKDLGLDIDKYGVTKKPEEESKETSEEEKQKKADDEKDKIVQRTTLISETIKATLKIVNGEEEETKTKTKSLSL